MHAIHNENLVRAAPGHRKAATWILAAALAATAVAPAQEAATTRDRKKGQATVGVTDSECRVRVAFGSECEALLLAEIAGAKTEVLVAVFTLTRMSVCRALASAAARGATVRVKYDAAAAKDESMAAALEFLRGRNVECVPIETGSDYAKMHHKFTVVDRRRVVTGSSNYTTAAWTANDENVVMIASQIVAQAYVDAFARVKSR